MSRDDHAPRRCCLSPAHHRPSCPAPTRLPLAASPPYHRMPPCCLSRSSTVRRQAPAADPARQLDAYTTQAVKDWGAVGLAIAVVKDGQRRLRQGLRRPRARQAGSRRHHDALRHRLDHQGDDRRGHRHAGGRGQGPLGRSRHELPADASSSSDPWVTREITVRDLLTHRAGLPNADYLWYGTNNSTAEILRRVRYVEPAYSLRSSFIYQNVMYAAAGQVIAAGERHAVGRVRPHAHLRAAPHGPHRAAPVAGRARRLTSPRRTTASTTRCA